jgi:spore coat polysaccharide biosynthesis protein SpsF (cytidylyltransferase family)
MHNVTVLIQARVGSSRFPQKVLKKIEGKPMIWHVVNRVKQTNLVNQIALVTTKLDEDKKLLDIANELGVIGITGDENNVLKRFYDCASQINADPIIRITGDCPLIDPFLIDEMIKFFLEHDYDYISNRMIPTFPDGLDIEIFSYTALRSAILNSKLSSELEHVTPYISKNPQKFKLFNFQNNVDLSQMRWCVDEKEDLVFVKKIFEKLSPKFIFSMDEILKILKNEPTLLQINNKIIRDEGYLKSLKNDKKIIT